MENESTFRTWKESKEETFVKKIKEEKRKEREKKEKEEKDKQQKIREAEKVDISTFQIFYFVSLLAYQIQKMCIGMMHYFGVYINHNNLFLGFFLDIQNMEGGERY